MKLFEFDEHIGDWRVLVQSRDIQNGAIQSRHITDNAVTNDKIGDGEVKSRNIAPDAVTSDKIGDKEVKGRNIAPNAIGSKHIQEHSIGGDHFDGDSIKHGPLANDAVWERNIKDRNVTGKKIAKENIDTEHLKGKAVRADKLGDDVQKVIVLPVTNALDQRFTNITNELYSMIESLQVGGIALSQQFGNRTDIGISQKTLTKAFGRFWDEMSTITGKTYMDFTLTVVPTTAFIETSQMVEITADCSDSISNFDSIKIYIDDVLVAESSDIEVFTTSHEISQTSNVRAVGVILGKTITKAQQVIKEIPFFMGSGINYQDVMTMDNHKELEGTLEGDYDLTVKHDGEHMFIIIPASHKSEFRRANMKTPDMGGYEIPLDLIYENQDYVVYKSQAENGYIAGTYNIDININS